MEGIWPIKEYGVSKENAKYKIVYNHPFGSTRNDILILSQDSVEEAGVYLVSFDRPGYGESDPDSKRTHETLALNIEELADQLGLGKIFFVVGFSMGGDRWAVRIAHYAPLLTYWYNTQKWFPSSSVISGHPALLSRQDIEFHKHQTEESNQAKQQGEHESIHCDMNVGFGKWEFDPMALENPKASVHLWQGDDDKIIPLTLQRYIAERLPWIQYHEVPGAGCHLDLGWETQFLRNS